MLNYYKYKMFFNGTYLYTTSKDTNIQIPYTNEKGVTTVAPATSISKTEYDLYKQFNIATPDNDPATGQTWANDLAKQNWIKLQLQIESIKNRADKGHLIDDIAIWHNVFSETLIKIIIFKYSTEIAMRVKLKVISDVIAKYNLDLVIKDFKPDYVIPQEDKSKLIDGLKEIEAYDDGIYHRLAQAVGLEYGAIHNEVIDAYERIIKSIHPTQPIDPNIVNGKDTLSHELGGTTK